MRYAIQAVHLSRTKRLLPVAWRKEDVPKELVGLTYLEVKEGKEGELAKGIRDWIGEGKHMYFDIVAVAGDYIYCIAVHILAEGILQPLAQHVIHTMFIMTLLMCMRADEMPVESLLCDYFVEEYT